MGIQINGQTDRITAVDGSFSIQDLAEVNVAGVATASNFKTGTSNVHSTGYECANINATGIVTAASANFTGNVSIGGTLTYQDVTNIDSVGVVTARSGINVTGGNIGIGENNPQNSLHISGSSPAIRFADTGANGSAFSIIEDNNGLFKIRNDAGNSGTGSGIAFEVDAAERVRITSAGDVGIGTAVPVTSSGYASLSLADTSGAQIELKKFGGQTSYIWSDNNLNIGADYYGTGQNLIFKVNGNVERLRITSDGDVKIKSFGNASNASADALQIGKTDNNYGITILSATNAQGRIDFTDTEDTNDPQGKIAYYHDSNSLQFFTNGGAASNERMRIDSSGHIRFGSSGTGYDSAWSHSNYGNTEVAIDGGGGYGVLHFRGDGAGSVNTRFSMGVGDENFYMCYDDVNNRHNILVNSSGYVTKPQQPGVYLDALDWSSSNNYMHNGYQFWQTGNHWNNSTGTFTCPVAGKYLVAADAQGHNTHLQTGASAQYANLVPRVNNANVGLESVATTREDGTGNGGTATHTSFGFTIIVSCNANDTIRVHSNHGFRSNTQNHLTIYLLG